MSDHNLHVNAAAQKGPRTVRFQQRPSALSRMKRSSLHTVRAGSKEAISFHLFPSVSYQNHCSHLPLASELQMAWLELVQNDFVL